MAQWWAITSPWTRTQVSSSEKWKLNLRWDPNSDLWEWLPSAKEEVTGVGETVEKKELGSSTGRDGRAAQPSLETVWRNLKHMRMERPYDPAMPPFSTYPRDFHTLTQMDMQAPCVQSLVTYSSEEEKRSKCPPVKKLRDRQSVVIKMRPCLLGQNGWDWRWLYFTFK